MLEAPRTAVYVDTLLLLASLSFLMDYLLLWATAKVGKMPLSPRRLVLGSGIGTAYFVLYYLSGRGVGDAYGWFRAFPALVAVSFLMLVAAFYPLPWRALAAAAGYFYFIAVSSGGAGIASRYALGWGAAEVAASIAAILVIAELGWGIVQRSLWQRLYHVALEVELLGEGGHPGAPGYGKPLERSAGRRPRHHRGTRRRRPADAGTPAPGTAGDGGRRPGRDQPPAGVGALVLPVPGHPLQLPGQRETAFWWVFARTPSPSSPKAAA